MKSKSLKKTLSIISNCSFFILLALLFPAIIFVGAKGYWVSVNNWKIYSLISLLVLIVSDLTFLITFLSGKFFDIAKKSKLTIYYKFGFFFGIALFFLFYISSTFSVLDDYKRGYVTEDFNCSVSKYWHRSSHSWLLGKHNYRYELHCEGKTFSLTDEEGESLIEFCEDNCNLEITYLCGSRTILNVEKQKAPN